MQNIEVTTTIAAPIERCFLLSLSVDLHVDSAAQTQERAIAGRTQGVLGPGERVRWRGRHFGLQLEHEVEISAYDRPRFFEDRMVDGLFASFVHRHHFEEDGSVTRVRETLSFSAPFGVLGRAIDRLLLRAYFTRFLETRNARVREIAESADGWQRYLGVVPR